MSQAEPRISSPVFIELPAGLSFTALMGLEDSCGSSNSAVEKLTEVVTTVVDMTCIGQLLKEHTEGIATLIDDNRGHSFGFCRNIDFAYIN